MSIAVDWPHADNIMDRRRKAVRSSVESKDEYGEEFVTHLEKE
jgi:hypothetical protein